MVLSLTYKIVGNIPTGTSMFDIQAWYDSVRCTKGSGTYTVSFNVTSDKFRFISFQAIKDSKDSQNYLTPADGNIYKNQTAIPSNTKTKCSFTFNVPEGTSRICLNFVLGLFAANDPLNQANHVEISDFEIK